MYLQEIFFYRNSLFYYPSLHITDTDLWFFPNHKSSFSVDHLQKYTPNIFLEKLEFFYTPTFPAPNIISFGITTTLLVFSKYSSQSKENNSIRLFKY